MKTLDAQVEMGFCSQMSYKFVAILERDWTFSTTVWFTRNGGAVAIPVMFPMLKGQS